MNDYNYIITVDEDGSPCLSHIGFGGGNQKGAQKQNHKYYARAEDKGRWRYFYSPEEFRNWASGGIKKAKNAVNNAAGEVKKSVNARRELNEANKATGLGSGLKQWNAQRKYNKTAMGKAEQAVRGAASKAEGAARQAYDEARNKLGREATDAINSGKRAAKNAGNALDDLRDKAGDKISDTTKSARKKVKNLTDAVKEYGEKKLSDISDSAKDNISRARQAVEDKTGVTDQKNREDARRRAMMGLDDAVGDYADSDNRYQKSAKGKADKAVADAKDAAGKAKDVAEDAAKKAGDATKKAAKKFDEKMEEIYEDNTVIPTGVALYKAGKSAYQLATDPKLKEGAKRAASEIKSEVSDKVSEIRDNLRNLADSTGSKARDAAGRVKDAANNAASKAQNAAGEVTGSNAKKEMDAAGRRAMMGLDDAIGAVVDAQNRYNNSVGGRASNAASNAQASLKAAESKAKKALAKALDYLPDEQIDAIKDLIRRK